MKNRIDNAIHTVKNYSNPLVDVVKRKLDEIDAEFFGEQLDILGDYYDSLANTSNFEMCPQFMNDHKQRLDSVIEITNFIFDRMLEAGENKAKRGAIHAYLSHIIYLASMKSTPYRYKIGADHKTYSHIQKASNFIYSSTTNFPVKFVIPTIILQEKAKYIIMTSENPYNITEELLWFGNFLRDNKIISSLTELKESIAANENCVAMLSPFDTAQAIMEMDIHAASQCHISFVKHTAYHDFYSWIEPLLEYATNYMSLTFSIIVKEQIHSRIKNLPHICSVGVTRMTKSVVAKQQDALKTTVAEFRKAVEESLQLGFASNIVVYIPSSEIAYRMAQSLLDWYKDSSSVFVWDNPNLLHQTTFEISNNFKMFMKNKSILFAHYFIMPLFLSVRSDIPLIDENFGNNVFKIVFINTVYENYVPFVTRVIDSGLALENRKLTQIYNLDRDKRQRKCVRAPGFLAISIVPIEPPQPKLPKKFSDGIEKYIKNDIVPHFEDVEIAKILIPEYPLIKGKFSLIETVSLFVKYLKNGGRVLINNPRSPRLAKYFEPRSDIVTIMRCFAALATVKPQPQSQMIVDHGLSIDPFCTLLTLFRTCTQVSMHDFKSYVDSEEIFDAVTKECEKLDIQVINFISFSEKKMYCDMASLTSRIGSENLECPESFFVLYISDCSFIHGIGPMATGSEELPPFGITSTYKLIFREIIDSKIPYKIGRRGNNIEVIFQQKKSDYLNDNVDKEIKDNREIIKKAIESANSLMPYYGTSLLVPQIGLGYVMEIVTLDAADYDVVLLELDEINLYRANAPDMIKIFDKIKNSENNIRIALVSDSLCFGYYNYDYMYPNTIDLKSNASYVVVSKIPIPELEIYAMSIDNYYYNEFTTNISVVAHAESEISLVDINNAIPESHSYRIGNTGFHYFINCINKESMELTEIAGVKIKMETMSCYSKRLYLYPYKCSKNKFLYRVHQALDHFGWRVQPSDGRVKYINMKGSEATGFVVLSIYGEISKEIECFMDGVSSTSAIHEWEQFNPNPAIVSKALLKHNKTQLDLVSFLKKRRFNARIYEGDVQVLVSEHTDCANAVEDMVNGFVPKYRAFPIKKDIRTMQAVKAVQKANRADWEVNKENRTVIIPSADSYDEIAEFVDDDPSVFGCTFMCETPEESTTPVTLWNEDGSFETKPLCLRCFQNTIYFEKRDRKQPSFGLALCRRSPGGSSFPFCLIGQVVMAVADSKIDFYTDTVRNWVENVKRTQYNTDRVHFTACPEHSYVQTRVAERAKCQFCDRFYCGRCKGWNRAGDPCKRTTGKRCPRCGMAVFKYVGCNHITCACGAHWCYVCGAGPWATQGECYDHLQKEHGGFFDNEDIPMDQMRWDFEDDATAPEEDQNQNVEEEEDEIRPFDGDEFKFISSDDEINLDSSDDGNN